MRVNEESRSEMKWSNEWMSEARHFYLLILSPPSVRKFLENPRAARGAQTPHQQLFHRAQARLLALAPLPLPFPLPDPRRPRARR